MAKISITERNQIEGQEICELAYKKDAEQLADRIAKRIKNLVLIEMGFMEE